MPTDLAVTDPSSVGVPLGSAHQPPADAIERAASGPAPLKKRIQKHKAPKDSKIRKVALATIALRAQGLKYSEIGETLGYPTTTIQTYMKRAVKLGYVNLHSFSDPDDQLEHVLKTKVVKNLNTVLDETTETREDPSQPSNRAFEASLEIAKGTGLLKQHQVVKTDQQTNVGVALKVQVEMPPPQSGVSAVAVRPGTVSGTSSTDIPLDAELVSPEGRE